MALNVTLVGIFVYIKNPGQCGRCVVVNALQAAFTIHTRSEAEQVEDGNQIYDISKSIHSKLNNS